ncbi:TetR family transcriptional regulator [Saccharothrix deserti]|uniref:TetR family transcriptional regulator n=1 Tax=Saccharothrix deserti TaxID=2593674 RepID=UPI00131ECCE3|nr:TetR family transcriptional regulator [Saccharothrix deserti]
MVTPGRRELHKAATRRALQDAALDLFERHGYERTTVRDVASAAGVTERTFFRYFPSKEDLVLGEVLDLIPVLAEAVRARPAGEPPYEAVLNGLLAVAEQRGTGLGVLFSGPPAHFMSRATRAAQPVLLQFEDGLAAALADRLTATGDREVEFRASVLARASVAAMRSTLIAFGGLPESDKGLPAALRLVREAFDVLVKP